MNYFVIIIIKSNEASATLKQQEYIYIYIVQQSI